MGIKERRKNIIMVTFNSGYSDGVETYFVRIGAIIVPTENIQ